MDRIEKIARALCNAEGRAPDFLMYGVPQWKRYEWKATLVALALDDTPYRDGADK